MKDEYGGKVIYEFAAPKPKAYTVIDENNYEKSVHKGDTCKNIYNGNISLDAPKKRTKKNGKYV